MLYIYSSVLENTYQFDPEEHSGRQLQVKMTVSTTAENDSLTTINFINHHTVIQNVVMYNSNCSTNSIIENVAASNVSAIDLSAEDNMKPTRFHVNGLNLTVLHRLAATLGICFIVGLFALPILFFYIRPSPDSNMANSSSMSMVCTHAYTCIVVCIYIHYIIRMIYWKCATFQ